MLNRSDVRPWDSTASIPLRFIFTDMHDTHTQLPALDSPQNIRRYYTARKRPGLLQQLFNRWAVVSLVCLSLQLTAGIRISQAQSAEPGSGILVLHHPDGYREAIQLDAHIELSVQGLLAEMSLKQTFRNTTDAWLEGSYLFPLPEDSAVRGLTLRTGDRTVHGTVKTRSEAKKTYTQARDAGKVAGLIEQQRPNLFTMKLASIAPGDLIEVSLDVMLPVGVENGLLNLTLPTTLTPRYSNSGVEDSSALQTPFAEPSQIRGPRLSLSATIAPVEDYSLIKSTTHTLLLENDSLSLTDIAMDRDVKLSWPAPVTSKAQHHAFISTHEGQRYVQLLINPPRSVQERDRIPRELILVIDKSGSMAGVSMDAAKQALHYAIDELGDTDYLNIVAFDDQSYPMFPSSLIATDQNKKHARQFIDQLNADGGTEMDSALSFALANTNQDERLRQLVFLTDGSVAYEDALLAQIKRRIGSNRLFTIGIGPAPNTWFLEKAAQAGRGIALSIQDSQDVAKSITDLLTDLTHPAITDLAVQYPSGNGEAYPMPIPDLYIDKPNMLVSRISDDVHEIIITGRQGGERWRQTIKVPPLQSSADKVQINEKSSAAQKIEADTENRPEIAPALAMHWTRKKIESLMDEQRFSVDNDLHKHTITQLALEAGLISKYTSFVAVEQTPVAPASVKRLSANVNNLIPAGNQMMSVSMPQGAAGADTIALISLLMGLTGLGLYRLGRVGA